MARLMGICPMSINRKKERIQSFPMPRKPMVFRFKAANQCRCRDLDSVGFHLPPDTR